MEEELEAKKKKKQKTAGLDKISPKVWKARKFDNILFHLCNIVYKQNTIKKWTKNCILPDKGDHRITKNYRSITLTAKVYNALLLNCIWCEIEKMLRKKQNSCQRNWSTTFSQFQTIHQIIQGVCAKNLKATLLFVGFLQGIWFHRQRKDGTNATNKETVTIIMILYKNMKVMVCSLDGDINYFDIVAGVLQGDTLLPCMFIIRLDDILWMQIDLIKKCRQYPTKTMTDTDYTDDQVRLAITLAQAESLPHSLKQTVAGIYLYVNVDKTVHMF